MVPIVEIPFLATVHYQWTLLNVHQRLLKLCRGRRVSLLLFIPYVHVLFSVRVWCHDDYGTVVSKVVMFRWGEGKNYTFFPLTSKKKGSWSFLLNILNLFLFVDIYNC